MMFLLCQMLSAEAATRTGIPTDVTILNSSAYGTACVIDLGGTEFYVDDVSGNFGATCFGALAARAYGKSIRLSYSTSSSPYVVSGMYSAATSTSSSSVDYIYTNDYTGTSSADQCKVYLDGTAGSTWYYVDDGGPEEDLLCGGLFLLQYSGRAWSVGYSGSELLYLVMK